MLDDLFWITLLLIFLVPLFGAFFASIRKDRCLKSFDNHHITYIDSAGQPCWGDFDLTSHGFEIIFDDIVKNGRGLEKASMLVSTTEGLAGIGFFRIPHVLRPDEKLQREIQIRRTFQPSSFRKLWRRCRSIANIVRDAMVKSFTLLVGAVGSRHRIVEAVSKQKGEVTDLGNTLAGAFSNAYEPLLERHIGLPVVVELKLESQGTTQCVEYPGYLMDYTKDFIAIFQTHDEVIDHVEIALDDERDFEGGKCKLQNHEWHISCVGEDALVIHRWESDGKSMNLGIMLMPGCTLQLSSRIKGGTLHIDRVRNFDMVCPRSRAQVRYAGRNAADKRLKRDGVAPNV